MVIGVSFPVSGLFSSAVTEVANVKKVLSGEQRFLNRNWSKRQKTAD
jgi:hypothetical protein